MRRLSVLFVLGLFALSACEKDTNNPVPGNNSDTISVSMAASYAEDVFVKLVDATTTNADRTVWEVGFSTNPMSSNIIINEGHGIELYTLPDKDASNWAETVAIDDFSGVAAQFNADTSWFYGAFDRNDLGHPDYGWGVYNQTTHDVLGDSLYILKLPGDVYKKMLIESRTAMSNSFNIKFADLDGSNEVTAAITCGDYLTKNYVYYSLTTQQFLDREPANTDWDLVFTKYHDESIPYIVTGILSNDGVMVAQVDGTDVESEDYSSAEFSGHINIIGSDWKEFDMGTFTYSVAADRVYFVKDANDNYYKLVLLSFDGSSTGNSRLVLKALNPPGN
jgi:hypothetical protein